jgi:four helix bundle protein
MTPAELRSRTQTFAADIVRFCETLPRNGRAQEIAVQLVDAASGVGSNYRSVCRARSRKDFINKLAITLDCADESLYWLQLLIDARLMDSSEVRRYRNEAEELTKILAASHRTARQTRRSDDDEGSGPARDSTRPPSK